MNRPPWLAALRIAGIYTLIGAVWIIVSDRLVSMMVHDLNTLTAIQTYKGWAFVLGSGLLILIVTNRELNERAVAEDMLRGSETMLRNILSTSPVGIVGLTHDRIVQWANEACLKMFGYGSEDEIVGQSSAIVYQSDAEYDRAGRMLYEDLGTGNTTAVDATLKRKDGSLFEGNVRMKALDTPDLAIAAISDISERRRAEDLLKESEARIRTKLDSILLPGGDIGALGLADVVDIPALQALMDDFYSLSKIPVGMIDLDGKVLVATGWQEICTRFHRENPETCQYCVESDTVLSEGVEPGSSKLYRCMNNMWDISTPIALGGRALGNIFLGQFLFEDEEPDYDAFRRQAHHYGFDEHEYLAALDKVPRWTKETVHLAMSFYIKLANIVSALSYSNIKLARSLSQQEQAEKALRESEERYRATFNNAAVGIDLVDLNGRFLQVNAVLSHFLGYTEEELRSLSILDVTHPEDVAESALMHDVLVRGETQAYKLEKRYVRKDGSVVWADTHVSAIRDGQGHHIATVGVILDTTKSRQLAEIHRRLATTVEQVAETIVITDIEGTILYVNPAFEKNTGYSREEAIGKNPRILKSGQHDEGFYKHMWDTIASGAVWKGHLITRRKDGTLFDEEATISPIKNDAGKIINYVAVKRDVTKEVSLQKQLFQAHKMEAIGTLAGGIAHDFNNLLQVTLGYSEILLENKSEADPDYADLHNIHHAARSGAELVRSLLTFSRKTESKPVPMNLNNQIQRVEKLLHRTIPKMIDIRLDLEEDLARINADPAQIEQIVMNLAVNARDAMDDEGSLSIRTENVTLDEDSCRLNVEAKPGRYVLLSVSDTGHGMDKETLQHIFEPFYTTKEVGRGTGPGLAMVHGIVQQHHGRITCYSEVGKGTTFKLYFAAISPIEEPTVEATDIMPAFGTETVLLVDDEDLVRELGRRILTRSGYTVLTATNGEEALKVYGREKERIALVILDLIMPTMGGKDCLKEILDIDPRARSLIASGYSTDASTRECVALGARGFVGKPFRPKELLRQVRKALDEIS